MRTRLAPSSISLWLHQEQSDGEALSILTLALNGAELPEVVTAQQARDQDLDRDSLLEELLWLVVVAWELPLPEVGLLRLAVVPCQFVAVAEPQLALLQEDLPPVAQDLPEVVAEFHSEVLCLTTWAP